MLTMAQKALGIAVRCLTYPLDVFYELLGRSNTLGLYWAFFLLAVVFRLLITPMIGNSIRGGTSDKAKRKRSNSSEVE